MNAARLEKSDRLRRVLRALKSNCHLTTRDLIEKTGCCAINSCVAELRANGYGITCRRRGNVWWYSLRAKA